MHAAPSFETSGISNLCYGQGQHKRARVSAPMLWKRQQLGDSEELVRHEQEKQWS